MTVVLKCYIARTHNHCKVMLLVHYYGMSAQNAEMVIENNPITVILMGYSLINVF